MKLLLRLSVCILLMILTISCVGANPTDTPPVVSSGETPGDNPEIVAARAALTEFFQSIQNQDYQTAARLSDGENLESVRQTLIEWHPDWKAEPGDTAAIIEKACTGGYACLSLRRIVNEFALSTGGYEFQVEFNTAEGERFELGPCCGADETESPPQHVFSYLVMAEGQNQFRVLWQPIYVP